VLGGVAGAVVMGPAGVLAGAAWGQSIGQLSVVAVGTTQIGVLIGGVVLGARGGDKTAELIKEGKVKLLTLGDAVDDDGKLKKSAQGAKRASKPIVVIRPNTEIPERWQKIRDSVLADWDNGKEKTRKGKLSSNTPKSSQKESKLSKTSKTGDEDIMGSDILSPAEKVMLLVSRTLNDGKSFSTHLFHELVKTYQTTTTARTAIADAHGVVHFVLLEVLAERPELLESGKKVLLSTALAVDSLAFGLIYDHLWNFVCKVTANNDLRDKILSYRAKVISGGESRKGSDDFFYDENSDYCGGDDDDDDDDRSDHSKFKPTLGALKRLQLSKTPVDKLGALVLALETACECITFSVGGSDEGAGADTLLHALVRILLVAIENDEELKLHAEMTFIEEYARDDHLMAGKEGYALVTFQAALHFVSSLSPSELEDELGSQL